MKMLAAFPMSIKEARKFNRLHHRHNPIVGIARFACAIVDDRGTVRGVAICGNAKARLLDQPTHIEILRCCTDGVRNGCSMLYGMCCRIAKEMGYLLVITYTRIEEVGASLRAAGFVAVAESDGGEWDRPSRPRARASFDTGPKRRWERRIGGPKFVRRAA